MKSIIISLLLSLLSSSLYAQTAEEAQALHDKGRECFNAGKVAEGREYTLKAMEMRKTLFGEVSEDYITSLNNYALSFSMEKDNDKAIELQAKVLQLCDKLPKPHRNIGMYTMNMGRFYYLKDDKDNAIKYWEKALPLVEKNGELYEKLLEWLGMEYIERKDVENQARIMALTEEHNQHELTLPCEDVECMTERAEYYSTTGDKAKAKECYLKALSMNMTSEQKVKTYLSYAKFLTDEKDFASSAEYYYMAAETKRQAEGEDEEYIQIVYNAAVRMYLGKQFDKSLDYYQKAVAFYEGKDTEAARKNIAMCHKGMGNVFSAMKNHAAAKEEYKHVLDYYAKEQPQSETHADAMARLATADKFNKDYDASISHYKEAIAMYQRLGLLDKAQDTQNSLNLCYAYAGKPMENTEESEEAKKLRVAKSQKIIDEELGNLELTRQYLGETQYAQSLGVIAGSYLQMEEYAKSVNYYTQYMQAIRGALRNDFQLMNENERMLLWKEENASVQEIMDLLVTLPVGNENLMPSLSSLAYDCMLLSKGILLNSSIEFEKLIALSGNTKLKEEYEKTKQTNEEIKRLRLTAATDADLQKILQLQQQNQQRQLNLYRNCAEIADFTDYIGYDWKAVKQKLSKDDVAIEFASIKTGVFDTDNYMAALVLTKDMSSPVALPICTFADLNIMKKDTLIYATPLVGNVVWGQLAQYIKDKRNIYFSADGDFNYIGIEYLQYEGKPLSEQKNVYRLSTTKQLCYQQPSNKTKNAVLFGDINYTEEGAKPEEQTQRSISAMRGASSSSDDDMAFANLDNTKKEIDEVEKLLSANKVTNILKLSDVKASTEAFLSLNDSKVNILHLATHGAYIEVAKSKDENDAMRRSLLAFAGANLGDGSGIVTAADIAKMNLRHCNLAVLSACETALGQMGSDGVFGLQRGFKNAGVHTLLMSLRKVNDEATMELMIQFYRSLMAGQTPNQALRSAQQYLRKNGYDKPEYWASFIVLDGQK
ncbi:MAG: CHAT domain-containing protein [Prevotella sp.]